MMVNFKMGVAYQSCVNTRAFVATAFLQKLRILI